MTIKSTSTTTYQRNAPDTPQMGPREHITWYYEYPLNIMSLIINLLLYITLLLMVLTWTVIQYPIKLASILRI